MAESSKPHVFNPEDAPVPHETYSQVAITPILPTSKLITLAGQTGRASDGTIPSDFATQAKDAYKAISTCLKAAGATPRDIIHVRHYIVDKTGNEELDSKEIVQRGWGPLWMEFMDREGGGHRPPDTVLGVASLADKGLHYECEVWAILHT